MDPNLLAERGWRDLALKFKIKDNGLQRALAGYEKLPDDKHPVAVVFHFVKPAWPIRDLLAVARQSS